MSKKIQWKTCMKFLNDNSYQSENFHYTSAWLLSYNFHLEGFFLHYYEISSLCSLSALTHDFQVPDPNKHKNLPSIDEENFPHSLRIFTLFYALFFPAASQTNMISVWLDREYQLKMIQLYAKFKTVR